MKRNKRRGWLVHPLFFSRCVMKKGMITLFVIYCVALQGWADSVLILADEQAQMSQLKSYLVEQGHTANMVDQDELPENLAPYEVLIQYLHSTMKQPTAKAIMGYAEEGGRLLLLHHAIASSRWKNPDFLQFVGIHLDPRDHSHTPWKVLGNVTHTMVNVNPTHYITSHKMDYPKTEKYTCAGDLTVEQAFPAFDMPKTEVFLHQQFTDGYEKTVLFGVKTADPESGQTIMQDRSGWLKRTGKGWTIYLQAGHATKDYKNPYFLQVIDNCITWKP
ncbi:hypothetical protein GF373_11575 [bacterium]|nr:hypothetical protein [bacterium]